MKCSIAAVALAASTTLAAAADLPYRAPPPLPLAPEAPAWTGPYFGVLGGYSFGRFNDDPAGKDVFCTVQCAAFGGVSQDLPGARSNSGSAAGGAQLGYDAQIAPSIVLGAVVDAMALSRQARSDQALRSAPVAGYVETIGFSDSLRQTWLATARLKAGVIVRDVLLYATGGLAAGGINAHAFSTDSLSYPTGSTVLATGSGGLSGATLGYAVGVGAEYRFSAHWSVSGEYLYHHFDRSYPVVVSTDGVNVAPQSVSFDVRPTLSGHMLRAGLNYRL